jgi:hypothetical protein
MELFINTAVRTSDPYKIFSDFFRQVGKETLQNYTYQLQPCLSVPRVTTEKTKLRGRSPQANYTDRATAACRRS